VTALAVQARSTASRRTARVVWILAAVALAVASSGGAQVDAPASPCIEAAKWHYRAALHWTESDDQLYHVWAGEAAERLGRLGDDCAGWKDDAKPIRLQLENGVVVESEEANP